MNQLVRSLQLEGLSLTPLTPTIGAEVSGIDLAKGSVRANSPPANRRPVAGADDQA